MGTTNRQLTTLELGDTPEAWAAAGFLVRSDAVQLGRTVLRLTGRGDGVAGWALDGVDDPVDGVAPVPLAPLGDEVVHPNGIERIDHVVVSSGDVDRTVEAFRQAGLDVRGGRSTTSYGSPMRQVFLWAGDVIVELIGPDDGQPTRDEPTAVFGLALVAGDLDRTATALGDLLGTPKDAVQPGRRIAGLRGATVGISVPLAVMSPHPR